MSRKEILKLKSKKNKPIKKTAKLSPSERHWKQVEERSKEIIDRLLDSNLPINFKSADLDLEKSVDWRVIARDEIPNYYEEDEKLPTQEYLAEEIAYHYLLTIIKRFITDLSEYACHDPAYWDQLTNYWFENR